MIDSLKLDVLGIIAIAIKLPERNEVEWECNVVDRREKFGARRILSHQKEATTCKSYADWIFIPGVVLDLIYHYQSLSFA
jgi:hypothetical protein